MSIRTHVHTYIHAFIYITFIILIHTHSELAAAKKVSDDQETIEKFFLEYLHQLQVKTLMQYRMHYPFPLRFFEHFNILTMHEYARLVE